MVPPGLRSDDDIDSALISMRAAQFTTCGTLGLIGLAACIGLT